MFGTALAVGVFGTGLVFLAQPYPTVRLDNIKPPVHVESKDMFCHHFVKVTANTPPRVIYTSTSWYKKRLVVNHTDYK